MTGLARLAAQKLAAIVLAAMVLALPAAAAPADWKEGVHYKIVDPMGKTAEPTVVEVFSYGCPVCFSVETPLAEWQKNKPAGIRFVRVPHYGVHDEGGWLIRLFYTAEALGIAEPMHRPLFELIHLKSAGHSPIHNETDAVKFLLLFGKSEPQIRAALHGADVEANIAAAKAFVQRFRVNSVPSFVINEKYFTSGQLARNDLFTVLSELPLK